MSTKKEMIAREVAKAVGAGKPVAMETVDFSDPNRPKTCLEVDFPILPVNQVAAIEGNAGKPIYQMSKWWARRRSSVFRSMLIAAATKAPDDPSKAAKLVWDNYYANHQKKGAFKHLKVADIFMGGGTTLVEGSRLGMQMYGNDLNPVAWFVVKQEFAKVDIEEVKKLLADVEAAVKPQIMPFYYCDGPHGQKGTWTHVPTGRVEGPEFAPLALRPEQRKDYKYEGPEIIYTFWAKHGPCQVTDCGHRTPIMSSPVIAVKTLTVKHWPCSCKTCNAAFDVEEKPVRIAPDIPLFVAPSEAPFTAIDLKRGVVCPQCGDVEMIKLGKPSTKKVTLSLLAHPRWLEGTGSFDNRGQKLGGTVQSGIEANARWYGERLSSAMLLEVRGILPEEVKCPATGITFKTSIKTVPKKSHYSCAKCGTLQDVLSTVSASKQTAPAAPIAVQCWSPTLGGSYRGRFFSRASGAQIIAAEREWQERKAGDLAEYWPTTSLEKGLETSVRTPLERYGYRQWSDFFNARQLLVHALLIRAIDKAEGYSDSTKEVVLAAFQQYLRSQNMFCIWDIDYDKIVPFLSKNNLQPPTRPVENCVFGVLGRGNWTSCVEAVVEAIEWRSAPWDLVARQALPSAIASELGDAKSSKVVIGDTLHAMVPISCGSSTELSTIQDGSFDLVITDPPFGDIMQYSELSGFFYCWLRIALRSKYNSFEPPAPPTALEAVENTARHGRDSSSFYSRLLCECWREAARILRPGGMLAFTFHHDKDEPWVAVLESLFNAGFYLEAAFPVRSDETKGEGSTPGTFGAQKVEYDVIHVCRLRTEDPAPVSWGRMRREVLADVKQVQSMLENHAKEGLPAADLQVIKRGKALEYFSRHYGKVFKSDGELISVKEALVGINQILDEDTGGTKSPPPVNAEPMTRQFLRIFDKQTAVPRDQMQKFMRGTGAAPDDFEHRGWCEEKSKIYNLVKPLAFAQDWQGRHRRKLTSDLDQALVLIGACFDNSGINAADTLNNENFKPHPALKDLLEWFMRRGADQATRNAAGRAVTIYSGWAAANQAQVKQQLDFFLGEDEAA